MGGFLEGVMSVFLVVLVLAGCQNAAGAKGGPAPVAPAGPPPAPGTAPAPTAANEAVVASWNGGSLTYADLTGTIKNDLTKLEADYLTTRYDTETQAMEAHIAEAVLDLEAKKRGLASADALLTAEVDQKVATPSDAEVQEAWNIVQRKFRGQPLEAVRPQVENMVLQRKRGERYMALLGELKVAWGVNAQLPFPNLPRFDVSVDDDPITGPENAPVTIIQFADYQCSYCGSAQETMDQVMKTYDGKVRFVFRDFPLDFHESATPAAVAANCAIPQGKFWNMHGAIMKNQQALSDADFNRLAEEFGIDRGKWDACRKDPAMKAEVDKDMRDGAALGVTGTPAFFVNGIFLNGAQPYSKFQAIIDRELSKG